MAKILIFGDSITYGAWDEEGGWVQRLRKFLDLLQPEEHFVLNLGDPSDETTEKVLERFEFETKARYVSRKEKIIIFAIGINDSEFVHSENNFYVPEKKFKENIQKLINIVQ